MKRGLLTILLITSFSLALILAVYAMMSKSDDHIHQNMI